MELLKPEDQVGNQEVADFIPAVVEDQRSPFLMLSDPGIAVFVEVRTVEERQAMAVLGEVTWNPVDDDADAFGMSAVNEASEFVWRPVPTGRCIPTGDLITP